MSVANYQGMKLGEKSAKYRRFAKECLEIAAASKDGEVRATFLLMAQTWFRLARHAELVGRDLKPEPAKLGS